MTHLEPPNRYPRERLSHFLCETTHLPSWRSAEPGKRVEFVIPTPEIVHHRQRFSAELPKHQLLDEVHALEFEDFGVRLGAAIQGHADFPRTGKHLRILDGRFVADV